MKFKVVVFVLFLFTLHRFSFAQPGYMGKKFSIGYSFEFFPHANFSGNNSPRQESGFELAPEHHVNLTWVVNRRWELLFDLSRRKNDYSITRVNYSSSRELPDGYSYTKSYSAFEEKYLASQETYWMIAIRKYFKNQIAPVGMYYQFGYTSGSSRFKDENLSLTANYEGYYSSYSIPGREKLTIRYTGEAKLSYFSFGMGIKRPIVKYLYGRAECNVQFPLNGWNIQNYNRGESIDSFLDYHLIKGLETHNFIDIRLGVGWMF